MSLRVAVAAPFRQRGRERMDESEFVVALSLDREWFTPDQAKRLVDVATEQGLVDRGDGELAITFDPGEVTIPEAFSPDDDLLTERSPFERVLDELVASGLDKQEAVAGVNRLQRELGVTVAAAAVVFARRRGIDVDDAAAGARAALGER